MFQTPILFLVFNRPEPTQEVFNVIKKLKPKYLYIACDGPRKGKPEEAKLCQMVQQIVTQIDWDCELKTLFRTQNLGCGLAVSQGINWFFSEVEYGIILEDDCLPSPSFFPYCEELLIRYKEVQKVMMISGFNQNKIWESPYSYFFAYFGSIWGWATWRSSWEKYDYDMSSFDEDHIYGVLKDKICMPETYIETRINLLKKVRDKEIDTWDFQWSYARFINQGLSIVPRHNAISNIGFGEEATHTKNSADKMSKFPLYEIKFPMNHNPHLEQEKDYDRLYLDSIAPQTQSTSQRVLHKVKSLLKSVYQRTQYFHLFY